MKFCVDCRHWAVSNNFADKDLQMEFSKCYHPEVAKYDMISGERLPVYAKTMRDRFCGPYGTMWEAKSTAKFQQEPVPVLVEPNKSPQSWMEWFKGLVG